MRNILISTRARPDFNGLSLHFSNVHDDIGTSGALSVASQASHMVNPLVLASGAAATSTAVKNTDQDKLNLDEKCDDKEKIVDKEILKNGDATPCNTDNIDIDVEDQAYHNAGTMRYRKKTGSNITDLDSIEHLSDDEDKKNESFGDDNIDSVSMTRLRTENVSHRERRSTKKKLKNLEREKQKDQKVVDCLYLSLMCCDIPCTIL